jgi:hypothetical protein
MQRFGRNTGKRSGAKSSRPHHSSFSNPRNTLRFSVVYRAGFIRRIILKRLATVFFLIGTIASFEAMAGWWPFSKNNSNIPVHAYFYFSNGQEAYLGQHVGASSCQSAAYNYAESKNVSSSNWSYICCTIEKGSDCYRKIK